ncbi:outer membrane protein assembly factor BamA [Treponema sp. R80B11-R83G3]
MRFRVFALLLFTMAVLGYSQEADGQSSDEWYQGKPIREIVFSGLRNIQQSELDALMNPYKGRVFSNNVFLEIQGKLYALEYFERLEPGILRYNAAGSEVILKFTVVERPVVGRINFTGNSGLRRAELNDVITIKTGDVFNQAKVRTDIEAIKNKYIEKGYPNVSVTSSQTQSGDSSILLVFQITENEKISITKIEFQGNTRFPSNTLRGQLSLKAKSLLNDGAFQESKLLADREAVTKYYHERGYIEMAVRDVTRTVVGNDKGTNLILTFMIEEGAEFRFGGVTFEGNVIFTTAQLDKLVTSKKGEIVNMTRLEMDLQRVADLYYENGYIFNSIIRNPSRNYQTNTISYHITIVERDRAYIENIVIIGNNKTKTSVILREIPMESGDIFSKVKIMEAMRNLYNLQYFSNIIPDTLPGSTENLMDLVFTVEEQPTTEIQFGFTFSGSADPDTFPISGLLKWNDRNIAGSGNELGIELNSSVIDSTTLSVNYLHRWVMGLPLSLGTDLSASYSKRYATMDNQPPFFYGNETNFAFPDGFSSYGDYINKNKTPTRDFLMEYEQWYLSLGFSTGYRWTTFMGIFGINGGMRFGIIQNSYDAELFRPFDPALRERNNEWNPKNSMWFSLSLDQRDIYYDPSKGYYLYNRMGFYGILDLEREHYIRNDIKAQYYFTIFNFPVTEKWNFKSVFAFHAGLSTIFWQPGRYDLFLVEDVNKLAVDGMFIGRGWNSAYRNKGYLLLDSWVELRFPLVNGILAFDFFFDSAGIETEQGFYFGKNSKDESNFTIENMRFSYGGGFRFTLPQFPIRISLVKCFQVENENIIWKPGAIFGSSKPNEAWMGMDIVMSFVLSY